MHVPEPGSDNQITRRHPLRDSQREQQQILSYSNTCCKLLASALQRSSRSSRLCLSCRVLLWCSLAVKMNVLGLVGDNVAPRAVCICHVTGGGDEFRQIHCTRHLNLMQRAVSPASCLVSLTSGLGWQAAVCRC